jgi:hexosaminidase
MKFIMNRISNPILARLSLMVFCLLTQGIAGAGEAVSLLPVPLHVQYVEGEYVVPESVNITVPDDRNLKASVDWFAGLIAQRSGRAIHVSTGVTEGAAINVERISRHELQAKFEEAKLVPMTGLTEAYSLQIKSDGVLIQASDNAGMFYGLSTLWQLLNQHPGPSGKLPGLKILDAPEFEWRGLMLDSARHMQSTKFIKQYIDWMSLHKLNVFHWHLTDDQAWRLEIKAYPKLTAVGGYRVPAGAAPAADIDPATGEARLYGGFYSQEEVRDIVAHAASRHITVVPEIDVPGHASAAIVAYPELGVPGFQLQKVPASWGIYHNVFNLEESTLAFLETVFAEVVEMFPGEFIHLGGDEVVTEQWEASDRVGERMKELGIDSFQSLQNYYVERLQTFLSPHGRRVIGWDEILESSLPSEAVVMSWRGVEGAIEAAAKGHQAVLSPAPTLYLDHVQTAAVDAPPGRMDIITVRDIYEFNPLPDSLVDNRKLLLGLQGNLWTEHVRLEERAAYMTWPRATAIAELGWSTPALRNWKDFSSRLEVHRARMDELGINAAKADKAKPVVDSGYNSRREDRELELCQSSIVLALDDDAPINGERESFLLDISNPCWIWRDADLSKARSFSAAVGQVPFNFEIGASINEVVVNPPNTPEGELTVRLGSCDGTVVAELPLAPAVENQAATELPAGKLNLPEDSSLRADLCISFNRNGIDPIWGIDWVRINRAEP